MFVETTPPPWIHPEGPGDWYLASFVPTEVLAHATKEGLIEISAQHSVDDDLRMRHRLADYLEKYGFQDAQKRSLADLYNRNSKPREFERFVSLTRYGLEAARFVENGHEERRKAAGRSRGNQVRGTLLCWLYDNPHNVRNVIVTYIIGTTDRPYVNDIPVSRSECIRAADVLQQQGLIARDEKVGISVRLTALGVQCVEEYAGDWTKMSEDKNRPKSTIQIGVLGNVAGDNVAIQPEGPVWQEKRPPTGAGSVESEIRQLVAQIQELSARYAEQLDKPEQVKRDVADLVAEMKRPDEGRDKDRLKDTLGRLATRVSSVAVLTDSVRKLWGLLFG